MQLLSNQINYQLIRSAWPGTIAFLALTGLALLAGLPSGQLFGSGTPFDNQFQLLFPVACLVLYAIVAMSFAQRNAEWHEPASISSRSYQILLLIQTALILGLTLPYWLIYRATNYLPWTDLLALMGQMFIWGHLTGLFGLMLGLSRRSEIVKFNLKYLLFIVFLLGSSHPAISFVNPFATVGAVLGEGAGLLSIWGGPAIWTGLAAVLSLVIHRQLQRRRKEPHESTLPKD